MSKEEIKEMLKKIGNRFKSIRKERNLTQEKVGNMLNCDQSAISYAETGETITLEFAIAFCLKFETSLNWLAMDRGPEPLLDENSVLNGLTREQARLVEKLFSLNAEKLALVVQMVELCSRPSDIQALPQA